MYIILIITHRYLYKLSVLRTSSTESLDVIGRKTLLDNFFENLLQTYVIYNPVLSQKEHDHFAYCIRINAGLTIIESIYTDLSKLSFEQINK